LDSNEPAAIKYITVAPERGNMMSLIPILREKGIICSIGHSEATYEEAVEAVAAGSTMITHLFNAMRPLHHRNPGIFGVLGTTETPCRPYFGVIADGIHLHPAAIKIAFNAHPEGFILVTDAMHLIGLPDGTYPWVNGGKHSQIVKFGPTLRLEGTETIAGGSITLVECVNNFLAWSRESIPRALKAVTATPAAMLGCKEQKGTLAPGSDADLIIFSETSTSDRGAPQLVVDEVWKFGTRVHRREGADISEPSSSLRHAAP
jgi:N-acetylglucosamine-6-phosphate deacetylase